MGERNDVANRYVGLMMVVENTSWEKMSGSAIMAVSRGGCYCWRRESATSIQMIMTTKP